MIPFGTKIYPLLVKLRIYKDEPVLATKGPELEEISEETERNVTIQENDMELVIPKEQPGERQWDKEEDDFLLNLDLKEQIQKQVQEQGIPDFEKEVTLIFDRSNKMEQKVRLLFEDEILEAPREKRKKSPNKKKVTSHKEKRVKDNTKRGKHSK